MSVMKCLEKTRGSHRGLQGHDRAGQTSADHRNLTGWPGADAACSVRQGEPD